MRPGDARYQPWIVAAASKLGLSTYLLNWSLAGMQSSIKLASHFRFLSELVLSPSATAGRAAESARSMSPEDFDALTTLAAKNHVIVRALTRWKELLTHENDWKVAAIDTALQNENARIGRALSFLHDICATLEQSGCPVTVIKSLDHWPDLGSDLDLYSDADPDKVVQAMCNQLHAEVDARSWGDRLANKWNFVVPGLSELVEIHIGRLGQTGEQTALTESLLTGARAVEIGSHSYRVLAPEHRIIISTLQRMYRHFYIRLCDIVDNACLIDSQLVDLDSLHVLGRAAGIWEGIATYLAIISGFAESYRGYGLSLPALVTGTARFDVDQVRFGRDFLRVPILPHSLNLYAAELRTMVFRGQVRNSLRLSLLPGLATAAALEMKLTGSDKGIW